MSDKLLDRDQIISGLAVMLSFFVGYKYATKKFETRQKNEIAETSEASNIYDKMGFTNDNFKMVLVVRNDLRMGKGKIASQCAHGAVGAFQKAAKYTPRLLRAWENSGCAKIAVKVESEVELVAIQRAADFRHLNNCLIRDAGRTQIEPNSKTVLAIGPAAAEDIDFVTGHLKLL